MLNLLPPKPLLIKCFPMIFCKLVLASQPKLAMCMVLQLWKQGARQPKNATSHLWMGVLINLVVAVVVSNIMAAVAVDAVMATVAVDVVMAAVADMVEARTSSMGLISPTRFVFSLGMSGDNSDTLGSSSSSGSETMQVVVGVAVAVVAVVVVAAVMAVVAVLALQLLEQKCMRSHRKLKHGC